MNREAALNLECSGGMGGHTYEIGGMEWVRAECCHVYVPEGGSVRRIWQARPAGGAPSGASG